MWNLLTRCGKTSLSAFLYQTTTIIIPITSTWKLPGNMEKCRVTELFFFSVCLIEYQAVEGIETESSSRVTELSLIKAEDVSFMSFIYDSIQFTCITRLLGFLLGFNA